MSIKAYVSELEAIKNEIKLLALKRKKLKEKEKDIENKITEYLKSKDQPGLKHQGTAIILEEKEKFEIKKPKERNSEILNILEKYGIKDSKKVFDEINNAKKGDPVIKQSLKITKYKNNI